MTTTPAAPDAYEHTDSRALQRDEVYAQWIQNVGAGVGAATIVALLAWGFGADLTQAWRGPAIVGGVVFGLGMVVRAFVDEFRAERRWRKREHEHATEMIALCDDLDDVETECDALHADNAALRSENARLQRENASLNYEWRKAKATPRTVLVEDLVEPEAKRNARHIVSVWAQTGKRPSRSEMVPSAMTRTQWDSAYAELAGANLLTGTHTEAEMLHALNVRWGAPFPVDGGQDGAPTSSMGWEDNPSRQEMEP